MPLQASQARITIAGLGAGSPGDLTLSTWEALKKSRHTFLRTGKHPVVEWLSREGVSFSTFDHFYEEETDFQEVYRCIAEAVLEQVKQGPVLYAVPGHPLVAEESVRLIIEKAGQEGLEINFLPAVSFLDALFSAIRLDPGQGLQIVDGLRLEEGPPLPNFPAVVTQVYSRLVASDVKLSLLEIYPPEHLITVVRGAGVTGEERIESLPLYQLDRLDWVDHLTSIYVPGIAVEDDSREKYRDSLNCRFPLDPLVNLLARLRGEGGCPWDLEQDHQSLRPYLLEEAYEVLEALNEEDMYKICEELGDLLLQIVFHAQIASENQSFDMNDVTAGITEKIIRRHPHVFGSVTVQDSKEVTLNWEKIKAKEREDKQPKSILTTVSRSLPALMRAFKLQEKAAGVGFDWPDYRGALEKTREELGELEDVILTGDRVWMEQELGDLLFSVVNLARFMSIDPEVALSGTNRKFVKRFSHVEKKAKLSGKKLSQYTISELDAWWEEAKVLEKI